MPIHRNEVIFTAGSRFVGRLTATGHASGKINNLNTQPSFTVGQHPGKLTSEEFEIMKTHVSHGADILSSYDWLKDADEVVRNHHEIFNGSGYLAGIQGEDIPLNARIFAVVDVFDALTSKRPYKEPFSLEASVEIIRETRGSHFDPAVADLFLEQAETLYVEICKADESLLQSKLEESIRIYFH